MLKKFNVFALALLIIGQTILGPIGTSVAFADDPEATSATASEETVDKTELKTLLDKPYDAAEYEDDSYAEYVQAITAGQNVYYKNDATQEDVNEVVNAIKIAVTALKQKTEAKTEEPEEDADDAKEEPKATENGDGDAADADEGTEETKEEPAEEKYEVQVAANGNYDNLQESDIESVIFMPIPDQDGKLNVKNGDSAEFKFKLKDLISEHNYGPGSTLTFTLPGVFSNVSLKTGIGDIGEVTVNESTNTVTLIFNDEVREFDVGAAIENVFFEISATFNKSSDGLDEQVTIPGGLTLDLNFTPVGGTPIEKKTNNPSQTNADSIEWEVIVNKDLSAKGQGNVDFVDSLGQNPNHKFKQEDVTIRELTMNANGTYGEGAPETMNPTLSDSDTKMTLSLDSNKAYKITYKTYPEDPGNGGSIRYNNSATYDGSDSKVAYATVEYDTGIKKTVGTIQSDLTTAWEITVNENKRNLENITVTDEWTTTGGSADAKQELVDTVKVYEADGTTEVNSGFTFNQSQGEQGFNIEFTNIGTDTYVIKYKTKPTDDTYINNDMTVSNEVTRSDNTSEFRDNKSVTYYKTSFMLKKTTPDIDYAAKTIDWNIVANQSQEILDNPVFEDRFANKNMILDETSLKVFVGSNELTEDLTGNSGYTLTVLDDNEGFNIKINNSAMSEQVTIIYTTDYIIRDVGTNQNVYKNDVTLKSGNSIPDTFDTALRSSSQKPEQEHNGKKDGKYNYETKRFEWEVELNFNENTFTNAIFEDVISNTPDQTIENIKIYKGELNSNGDFINPVEVTNVSNSATDANKIELVLGDISQPYRITYESRVTDDVIPETAGKLQVTNTATLKDGTTLNASWTKTVGVNYTDKLINKTGSQNGNTAGIKWSFEFNYAQSDLKNIVITDDVGKDADGNPNQLYKEESFKVYPVTLGGKSDSDNFNAATVGATPLDPSDYTLNLDVRNGKFELKLDNGTDAYFVEYETVYLGANVSASDDEKVKNQVAVKYESVNGTEAEGSYSFSTFSYSGGGNVVKVPFVVIKTDGATGDVMPGIDFTLYHKGSGNKLISDTTDEEGIFDIGLSLSEGTYYLTEDNVQTGYDDPGNIEFTLHRDDVEENDPYKGYQVVGVENFPENFDSNACPNFTLTVKDANGNPRENVKVKYVNTMTGKEVDVTGQTNNEGKVTVPRTDLPAGKYKVVEIDVNGDEIGNLGEVQVKYDGNCDAQVQPNTCPNFTITVNDKNGDARQNVKVTVKVKNSETEVAEGITDADGKLVIDREDLPSAGTYDVFEGGIYLGEVVVDYNTGCEAVLDTTVTGVGSCPIFTLTVNDRSDNPREGVTVVVKDEDSNPIEDANGDPITGLITNTDGKVTIDYVIKPGTYTVYEVDANGNEKLINSFTVETDCFAEVKPRPSGGGGEWIPPAPACEVFTVTVKQQGTIVGANVEITLKSGTTEVNGTTDANGNIKFDKADLSEGTYTAYDKDGQEVGTIVVSYDEGQCQDEIDLLVKSCETFTITVKESGEVVDAGTLLTLKDASGNTVATGTTDIDGKISFDKVDLPEGSYKAFGNTGKEIAGITVSYDEGKCQAVVDILLKACEHYKLTVVDTPNTFVEVKDKDGNTVVTGTTDANGNVTFTQSIPEGNYDVYIDDKKVGSLPVTDSCEGTITPEVDSEKPDPENPDDGEDDPNGDNGESNGGGDNTDNGTDSDTNPPAGDGNGTGGNGGNGGNNNGNASPPGGTNGDKSDSGSNTGKLPQTGEEQYMYMIALGTLLLAAGASVLYRQRRKA